MTTLLRVVMLTAARAMVVAAVAVAAVAVVAAGTLLGSFTRWMLHSTRLRTADNGRWRVSCYPHSFTTKRTGKAPDSMLVIVLVILVVVLPVLVLALVVVVVMILMVAVVKVVFLV
jgi:hypothetical protein